MSYNLEIPYNTDDGVAVSLIFMFHQYLDMIHDSSIRPKTSSISMGNGMSFTDFLKGGIFQLGGSIPEDNINSFISILSGQGSIVYRGIIPNLFAILSQRGTWVLHDNEWVLSTATWEKQTIYSTSPTDNHNVFRDYAKERYGQKVITGFAHNQDFLKKKGPDVPWVAVDMTHSTGAGAWGSEIVRGGKAYTHTVGILDAGIGYKGFVGTPSIEQLNQAIKQQIASTLAHKNEQLNILTKNFNGAYANLTTNQQTKINKNLQLVLDEQMEAIQTLTMNKYEQEGLNPTSIQFTIFGVTFLLPARGSSIGVFNQSQQQIGLPNGQGYAIRGKIPQKSHKYTDLEQGRIPFLSKPQLLKMITLNNIEPATYMLRFGKYMGDFFQCIAYSFIQNQTKAPGEPIFLTGDGPCGLGYFLTQGYIEGIPSFMSDRKGMASENIGKPTLFYCLPATQKFADWIPMTSVAAITRGDVLDNCMLTMEANFFEWMRSDSGKALINYLKSIHAGDKVNSLFNITKQAMQMEKERSRSTNAVNTICTKYATILNHLIAKSNDYNSYIGYHNQLVNEILNGNSGFTNVSKTWIRENMFIVVPTQQQSQPTSQPGGVFNRSQLPFNQRFPGF